MPASSRSCARSCTDGPPPYDFLVKLRLPKVGIAAEHHRYRGYFRPEGSGPIELAVHLPAEADHVTAWAGKNEVTVTVTDGVARFTIPGRTGRASDWALSW